MSERYQFLRPLAFMTIDGPSLGLYRLVWPVAVTVIALLAYVLLPERVDLVGDKSAADYMAGFFATLPGFFIAALAAVATFNGGDLDKELPGVTVAMVVNGDEDNLPISLRVFLCYLFAYLTVISFVGFFICVGAALIAPSVATWAADFNDVKLLEHTALVVSLSFVALLTFITASVLFCTIQGLYFLAERVHQTIL
ncbi:hypothetical protein [Brevundimonas sp.]|uniref:hypothetical protein n=1 Tax=Brevundimonas sp. TaxID=1871086 RepID=UPI003564E3AD